MAGNFTISDSFKKRFAVLISAITYAPIISIPVFALINFFFLNLYEFIIVTSICAIFAGILPIILVMLFLKARKNGKEVDIDIPVRAERNHPLILVILSYIIGTVILFAIDAPLITTTLMFCYFSNTLILFFINLYWKISIHAMGVSGPSIALIYVFGSPGIIFSLIIPLVMWSRIYLNKHTVSQVIIGTILGLVLTALQMNYLI